MPGAKFPEECLAEPTPESLWEIRVTIRVVISDDHQVLRCGFAAILQGSEIEVVAEASNVAQTLEQVADKKPDVLVLDVRLGNEDGLLVIDQLQSQGAMIPVVVFSNYDNPTYVARTIALGGRDYLLKDAAPEMILDTIRRAASNQAPAENSYLRQVQSTLQKRKDRADSREIPLTNRELQVLRHIAFGLSNKEIGASLAISVETVKEHVQNILRKLDSADRTAAAVWAVKTGLIN